MTLPGVLFISHDASRTGAPFLLLHFLRWLKANSDIPVSILLRQDGVLRNDFSRLGFTAVIRRSKFRGNSLLRKLTGFDLQSMVEKFRIGQLNQYIKNNNIRLVFSNTIVNGDVLYSIKGTGCPVITYVHELEYWIRYRTDPEHLKYVFDCTDHYLAGSAAVRSNLVQNHNISIEKISVIHDFIPIQLQQSEVNADLIAQIRSSLGIPENALIVGGAGTADWRKGVDLFVQLSGAISRKFTDKPVHFIWVGGDTQSLKFNELRYDSDRLGLQHVIHFVGTVPDYLQYLAAFDIFSLTSREDCFPLVMLESALFRKPILCFDCAGGAKEFVEDDVGYVIPYLDIEMMADKAVILLRSEQMRATFGDIAKKKVVQRHDIESAAPKILQIIKANFNYGE